MPARTTEHLGLVLGLFGAAALAVGCLDDAAPTDAGSQTDTSADVTSGTDGDSSSGGDSAADAGPTADATPVSCGDTTCGTGELCMTVPGCPIGPAPPPECIPVPTGCGGAAPSCECFAADPCGGGCTTCGSVAAGQLSCDCGCLCASPDTLIATPAGDIAIAELREGDVVFSVHDDQIVAVAIKRTHRTRVSTHRVIRLRLSDGRTIEMSPGHPTADGRTFGQLAAGDVLDGERLSQVELIPYDHAFTYDILPDSDSGAYFAAGVLVGSTLSPAPTRRRPASTRR